MKEAYEAIKANQEIEKLKQEINYLKQKIQELENSNKTNYLQKDDSYHML